MKTYHYILTLIILLIAGTVVSCERMLEAEPPVNQMTTEQVFETVQTANAALAGLYSGLWDNSPLAGNQTGRNLGVYTDDLDFYGTTTSSGFLEMYENTLIDSNPTIYTYWTNAYQKIYMANAIIEGVENSVSIPTSDRQRIKAEAVIVRSLLFLYLQQIYGDIPYPVTTNYMINQTISKTPAEEVLMRITMDLDEIMPMISDTYRSTERIFPNKKVAQLVLAHTYMLQHKYGEAEVLYKQIRSSALYQFQNDLTKVFDKSGNHILWQLKPRNTGEATKEVMSYYFANSAPPTVALTKNLVDALTNGDLRKQHWISAVTVGTNTWYRPNKYRNTSNNATEYSILFRLEEVNLMLAEALTRQSKVSEAVPLVNTVKQRAGIPLLPTTISQTALLDEILLESRKEFFTEMGHRFFDLKRHQKLDQLSAVKPNWKSYHSLWPIPQKELLLNAQLNPQNNGY